MYPFCLASGMLTGVDSREEISLSTRQGRQQTMKNPLKIMLAVIAMGLLIGTSAQAVMISSGSRLDIGVSQVTLDTGNLDTANAVTNWGTALVTLASGDFSSVPLLSAATMATPWTFVNATPNLWSVGGFSFSLDAGAVISRTPPPPGSNFLNVSGTGTITGIGFDPTPGVWSFTATVRKRRAAEFVYLHSRHSCSGRSGWRDYSRFAWCRVGWVGRCPKNSAPSLKRCSQ